MKKALIVVDLQKDFCQGGALEVSEGDQVVAPINQLIDYFLENNLPIFLTRDWHPSNHLSFKEFGGIWPPHCIAGTEGANFHDQLKIPQEAIVVSTATEPDKEAYSGFEGTHLIKILKAEKVTELVVVGLATDYCVKETVLDGLKGDFNVTVVNEGIRAVNVKPRDGQDAVREMKRKGAKFVSLAQVVQSRDL